MGVFFQRTGVLAAIGYLSKKDKEMRKEKSVFRSKTTFCVDENNRPICCPVWPCSEAFDIAFISGCRDVEPAILGRRPSPEQSNIVAILLHTRHITVDDEYPMHLL